MNINFIIYNNTLCTHLVLRLRKCEQQEKEIKLERTL